MKKYFFKFLNGIFSYNNTVDPRTLHVYLDIEEDHALKDDPRRNKTSKKEILERFKSVYQKRTIKKCLFGRVIYKRIFIIEIKKIELSELKEKYLKYLKKDTPSIKINEEDEKEESCVILFESISNKPLPENPHI